MANQKKYYDLYSWCIDNNNMKILDMWDYELNKALPNQIAHMSTKKVWLKCPCGLHDSSYVTLQSVIKAYEKGNDYIYCKKCNSFGQYVINIYGTEYLSNIWSDKNEADPFSFSKRSQNRIWLKCQVNPTHPDYDLTTSNFINSHNCPYCVGKRVCESNSIGVAIPKSLKLWSDKNEKTPYDYTPGSRESVWWKCENNKHDDYFRMISRSVTYGLRCPSCGKENQYNPSGPAHPNWKGGVTTEAQA